MRDVMSFFAIYGKNGDVTMTQRIQRASWVCQGMKDPVLGIE